MLGITLGDVNGVGPDILLRAFCQGELRHPFVVYGDYSALEQCARHLRLEVKLERIGPQQIPLPGVLCIRDAGCLDSAALRPGALCAEAGAAALVYLDCALNDACSGQIDAIVTLPVNKEGVRLTAPDFTGHTDVVARACGTHDYVMTLITDQLVVPHVTAHMSVRAALDALCVERIATVGCLTRDVLVRLGRRGSIAVLGVNPHAGEGGAFGDEEIRVVQPALDVLRGRGVDVAGPVPPDTAFMRALRGDFAAVICMYHDQGHIAMKTVGFDEGVNVTVGLPIVRTSVDHGTAYDIAWKGCASIQSFVNAFSLARRLALP